MRNTVLAALLLVAGCSYGAPAVTPSPAPPTVQPTAAPSATAGPTSAATPSAGASGSPYCDPDYGYGCDTPGPTAGGPTPAPTEATNQIVIATAESADFGTYLIDSDGLALYTNANDSAEHSTCGAGCTDNWPPVVAEPGQQVSGAAGVGGTFGTLARDDGSTQVTYDGHPLYHFTGDSAAGDTNGQGVLDVWFLAAP